MNLNQYKGREWQHGSNDCFGLLRCFYLDEYSIHINDYARPDHWWDQGLNLYMENYRKERFSIIDVEPDELRVGDVMLMAIRAPIANHCAIYLGNGEILHHFYGRLSNVELYKGVWFNTTVAQMRHKDVKAPTSYERIEFDDLPRASGNYSERFFPRGV
jgi:cell wall-associated NlpC family hydrolase